MTMFNPKVVSVLEKEIQNLSFKWGKRHSIITGLQCLSLNTHILSHSWNVVSEKLEDLEGLEYRRSNLNFFATGEDAYYHKDDCDWTLLYYCNTTWGPDEKGETKFFITQDDLGTYETKDFEGNIDPLIVSVAPIPGRFCFFRSNIN